MCRRNICRKMNLLPTAGAQSVLQDSHKEARRCAVKKPRRRLDGSYTKINFHRMTLRGPNATTVFRQREALLVTFGNHRP